MSMDNSTTPQTLSLPIIEGIQWVLEWRNARGSKCWEPVPSDPPRRDVTCEDYEAMSPAQKAQVHIDYWNGTLRPHDSPRKLVRLMCVTMEADDG